MLVLTALVFCLGAVPVLFSQGDDNIVPRHPEAIELPELGRMIGRPGIDCAFGEKIYPIGDCDADGLSDWILTRRKCDTMIEGETPEEIVLYKGVQGGLPKVADGLRIGVTEIGSNTAFMASGDWDADGYVDVATTVQVYGDTSFGASNGTAAKHLVIWWGNVDGVYSVSDTTRLENGMDGWARPDGGFAQDFDHNGVIDLMLSDVKGYVNGTIEKDARVQIWLGREGERWGRTQSRSSSWLWWNPPRAGRFSVFGRLQWIDQDIDGYVDMIEFFDSENERDEGSIRIIYGKEGVILDTATFVDVEFSASNGKYALFSDITGDLIPELLLNCGNEETVKAYVGFKGQRIEEQYGLGNEPAKPGEEIWWGKPWATIKLVNQLHDTWAPAGWSPLFDFGDGGLDGIGDVWVYTVPDFIAYQGGRRFDSLYEGWIHDPVGSISSGAGWTDYAVLGDIDGSGFSTIAINYSKASFPGAVKFSHPTPDLPTTGRFRQVPPGTEHPDTTMTTGAVEGGTSGQLGVSLHPNPSSGEVVVTWEKQTQKESADVVIVISDILGQEVLRDVVPLYAGRYVWEAGQTFGGRYFVTVMVDQQQETIQVDIER